MSKAKILYISQEINPFLPHSEIADISKALPQKANENGREIRVFMPRFGSINERRHQLHEVIRLSGMNLIINDTDHPLIIKVASVPAARIQVYFIDNEEYFKRKSTFSDADGKFFEDNDERSMFFLRGVFETVKKLGWTPDIIHCHGWMAGLLPLYLKHVYKNDPHFAEAKVIYSVYSQEQEVKLDEKLADKLTQDGISLEDVKDLKTPDFNSLIELGMEHADAIIQGSETLPADINAKFTSSEKLKLDYQNPEGDFFTAYNEFYTKVLEDATVLAD
jgi:starch synthase